ncbi:uncharacterized protein LOC134779054 [Penaeus indicus]|uniref:uncharacterized protein LOC134779054 n=1 Tax=Penaeus indicus TaxID=29960 RepID=UPI00300D775A
MACIPLMAEESVVVVSPGYSILMLSQALSETGAHLAEVLLVTGATRNSIGAHLRGRGRASVDQVSTESVHLAKDQPAVESVKRAAERVDLLRVGQAEDGQMVPDDPMVAWVVACQGSGCGGGFALRCNIQ